MSERKKKTGDVITWAVVDALGLVRSLCYTREVAREEAGELDAKSDEIRIPHRIAKVVLAK